MKPPKPTSGRFPAIPPPPPPKRQTIPRVDLDPIIEVRAPAFQDTERPTGSQNATLSTYQPIVAVFDELEPRARLEFVELARLFAALATADRLRLIELAQRLGR